MKKLQKIRLIELPKEQQSLILGGSDRTCDGTYIDCDGNKTDKCKGEYKHNGSCDGDEKSTHCIGTYKVKPE